ncbi:MAG: 5'-methylthioadenosine/adenosylhomocysteine nucleosidase [Lachnospiraceae bacterium]|nr:5'-methylthioadenosine/adenosylhomocysteine nucleosidase [Lachnospiraceae bacterium]
MKRIGIIGAMDLEIEHLKGEMQISRIVDKAGMEFYTGTLKGVDVVIVRSGIGKVNAGLCAQILADVFQVTHIINTGVAGSLNAKLDIGDILISRDALYHDVDVRIFGYQLGEVPQMGCREFKADKAMIEAAVSSCKEVNPDIHVEVGRILSGDQFISDKAKKETLIADFQGDCTEMEGAAIAHSAYLNKIPFVIIRAISDKADDSAEMDYPTFEREAAKHSAKLVEHMITLL